MINRVLRKLSRMSRISYQIPWICPQSFDEQEGKIAHWKRANHTNSEVEIQSLKSELEMEFLRHDPEPSTNRNIKQRLSRAYHQEEIYWKIKI